jgi:hypothetical protein
VVGGMVFNEIEELKNNLVLAIAYIGMFCIEKCNHFLQNND